MSHLQVLQRSCRQARALQRAAAQQCRQLSQELAILPLAQLGVRSASGARRRLRSCPLAARGQTSSARTSLASFPGRPQARRQSLMANCCACGAEMARCKPRCAPRQAPGTSRSLWLHSRRAAVMYTNLLWNCSGLSSPMAAVVTIKHAQMCTACSRGHRQAVVPRALVAAACGVRQSDCKQHWLTASAGGTSTRA